jgi:hypothetical protein
MAADGPPLSNMLNVFRLKPYLPFVVFSSLVEVGQHLLLSGDLAPKEMFQSLLPSHYYHQIVLHSGRTVQILYYVME